MDPSIITMMILILSFDLSIVQQEVITIEICHLLWRYLRLVAQKHCREEHNSGETTLYRLWPRENTHVPKFGDRARTTLCFYTLEKLYVSFHTVGFVFFLLRRL